MQFTGPDSTHAAVSVELSWTEGGGKKLRSEEFSLERRWDSLQCTLTFGIVRVA